MRDFTLLRSNVSIQKLAKGEESYTTSTGLLVKSDTSKLRKGRLSIAKVIDSSNKARELVPELVSSEEVYVLYNTNSEFSCSINKNDKLLMIRAEDIDVIVDKSKVNEIIDNI